MNGVHDMGGMHGFGPIERGPRRRRFHADWEGASFGIEELTADRYFNLDAFRYGIERMEPAHYLRAPYFERWLATIEANLIEGGFLTGEELECPDGTPAPSSPTRHCRPRIPVRRGTPAPASKPALARHAPRFARRRCRGHAQRPSGGPHPAPALRARQAGRDPPRPRAADLPGHQRARAGRASAGGLQRPLRRPRALGRLRRAGPRRSRIDLWESYLEPRPVEPDVGTAPIHARRKSRWRTTRSRNPTWRCGPRRWNRS